MKKYLLPIFILFFIGSAVAQRVDLLFSEPYQPYIQWPTLIGHDNSGNVVVSSTFRVGSSLGGSFLSKYDANGNLIWKHDYRSGYVNVWDMSVDSSGNVYAYIGVGDNTKENGVLIFPTAPGGMGYYVKYDLQGNIVWKQSSLKNFRLTRNTNKADRILINGGIVSDTLYLTDGSFIVDNGNGTYIVGEMNTNGQFTKAVAGTGGVIFPRAFNGKETVYCEYGSAVTKYDSSNAVKWQKTIGAEAATIDEYGNVYVVEVKNNAFNLLKYDLQGSLLWKKCHWPWTNYYHVKLAGGKNGSVYIHATYTGSITVDSIPLNSSNLQSFLAKVDSGGNIRWIISTSGPGQTGVKDITSKGNEIFLTGEIAGTVSFGNKSTSQSSGVYIAKVTDLDTLTQTAQEYESESGFDFSVYPNPSGSNITVVYTGKIAHEITISIYSQLGQQIIKKTYPSGTSLQETFNLSMYRKGIYLVELISGSMREVRRVVIE